jgi:putative endonuclease
MYFVYVLKCEDGTLYTGITTDLARRFDEHKRGIGAKYTRAHKVAKILYSERKRTRSSAQKREAEIKSWPRKKKLQLW